MHVFITLKYFYVNITGTVAFWQMIHGNSFDPTQINLITTNSD